jgi:hypothetical protein
MPAELEPPAGERVVEGYTATVYTEEQQQRLGVDETGKPRGPASSCATAPAPPGGEEDIALEEPDVFYLWVSRMHLVGCCAAIALFLMHRAGVEAIEGWWLVCTPFFPAVVYSRLKYHRALRAKHPKQD